MSAYVEVRVPGGGRAIVEAASVIGMVMPPGLGTWDTPDDKRPLALILRGGETINVVGEKPGVLLVRCAEIRRAWKDEGATIKVDFLDKKAAAGALDDDDTAKP